MATPELPDLQYGQAFNRAIRRRLGDHFTDAAAAATADMGPTASRALVVGLFGEWGSGKTLQLRHLRQGFEDRLRADLSGDEPPCPHGPDILQRLALRGLGSPDYSPAQDHPAAAPTVGG